MRTTYEGSGLEILPDEEIWPALDAALRGARHEVLVTQLNFQPGFAPAGRPLADALEEAARRGARVAVVLNENAAIPDSADELAARFEGTPVETHRLAMSPNVMHAKLVVVDAREALLVDPPFEQKYVDTHLHAFTSTRGRHDPFHAVSARLTGPAVEGARGLALRILAAAGARPPSPAPPPRPVRAGIPVEIRTTEPPGLLGEAGALDILAAYEDAIASARGLVYLESQYFTSPRIRDALAQALAREPRLEAILLLNVHMDVPGYDAWQARRFDELGALDHPRMGVFALRSAHPASGDDRAVYIHSKVALVDESWATVGSANLDSVSLHEGEEFPVRVPPNVELNAVVRDRASVLAIRRRVWGEHLQDRGVWRDDTPPGGWLARWRDVAEENAARLDAGDAKGVGRLVPFAWASGKRREALSDAQPTGP